VNIPRSAELRMHNAPLALEPASTTPPGQAAPPGRDPRLPAGRPSRNVNGQNAHSTRLLRMLAYEIRPVGPQIRSRRGPRRIRRASRRGSPPPRRLTGRGEGVPVRHRARGAACCRWRTERPTRLGCDQAGPPTGRLGIIERRCSRIDNGARWQAKDLQKGSRPVTACRPSRCTADCSVRYA